MSARVSENEDTGQRAAEIVDLFARDKAGGQSNGLHRIHGLVSKNDKGGMRPALSNVLVVMAHDPPLAGMLAYNEFTWQPLIMRSPPPAEEGGLLLPGPYPRPWGAEDVSLVQAYLQRLWCEKITRQTTEDAMLTEACVRRFHPVRDWLATLKWDGRPTIDHWLHKAFGCPNDAYHAAIGAKFLIAAARRVRQPGCKFDYLPVLEGGQGIGKSSAVRALFGERWYSDAIPEELSSKDSALALDGIWGLEFAEIQHLIRNEVEVIKAFLSRSTDRYRPPYGRSYVNRPRQGVLIGTTNADDYLRDTSGNRRIWPVKCEWVDVAWVVEMRDHLWAEAAHREALGEDLWLSDDAVKDAAQSVQSDRMSEDVWTDPVRDWINSHIDVRIPDILSSALNIPKDRQGKREEMRVSAILTVDGWVKHIERSKANGNKATRVWRRPIQGSA